MWPLVIFLFILAVVLGVFAYLLDAGGPRRKDGA